MPTIPRQLYHLAFQADARFDLLFRRMRKRLGIARPLRILPYRGFGTPQRACIKARVQEDRSIPPPAQRRSLVASAVASYKRYATVEIPGADLRVRWGDSEWQTRTDEEGFVDLWVEPPAGIVPGWHRVTLELLSPDDAPPLPTAAASVLVVDPEAEYGVISDIDDTVIVTGVTNKLKRAYALFLTEHRTRLPFEGVAELYRAFHEGMAGMGRNPIFYVSSSPWNLYEHLEDFLAVHGIPAGPILLRDWGLSREGFAPGGGHGHKLAKIQEVLHNLPDLRFVLFGDSGQEDAEHYLTIVREQPDRIRAVYIRTAHHRPGRDAELERIAQQVRRAGSEMLVADDSVSAARHAARRGLIRSDEILEVARDEVQEKREGTVVDDLLE